MDSQIEPTETVEVQCGARASRCVCVLSPHDSGPHECDPDSCNGSWEERDGEFIVHRLPTPAWLR